MIDPHVMIAYHKCHTSKSFCYEIKMQVIWLLHWQLNMHLWAPQKKKKKAFMGAKTGQLSKIIIQISANRPNTTTYT